jgi:hypothetical protein
MQTLYTSPRSPSGRRPSFQVLALILCDINRFVFETASNDDLEECRRLSRLIISTASIDTGELDEMLRRRKREDDRAQLFDLHIF